MQYNNNPNNHNFGSRLHHGVAVLAATVGYNGLIFNEARQTARACGKPLLNVGCKRSYIDKSDINLDIVPREDVPHFVRGDVQNLSMLQDGQFGAAYAAHVLEHVADPEAALRELHRVAENVFVITPPPISPLAWFYPGHRWVFWCGRKLCAVPRPLMRAACKLAGGLRRMTPAGLRRRLRLD